MDVHDDLSTYNGKAETDMWVDIYHYETPIHPIFSDDDNLDEYVDNLNDSD